MKLEEFIQNIKICFVKKFPHKEKEIEFFFEKHNEIIEKQYVKLQKENRINEYAYIETIDLLMKDTKFYYRNSILHQINVAYKLYEDIQSKINNQMIILKQALEYTVQLESYRMFIINYLWAMLGEGRNNQISIFNSEEDSIIQDKINIFKQENKYLLNNLKVCRDKVYAHVDKDYPNKIYPISDKEIKKIILFLNGIIKYTRLV